MAYTKRQRLLDSLNRWLGKSDFVVDFALTVRFYCSEIIKFHLIGATNPRANGEKLLIETLVPRISLFFDIGANVGNWTNMSLNAADKAGNKIVGFLYEPDPDLYKRLKERFESKDNLHIFGIAMGGCSGTEVFYKRYADTHSSLLRISGEKIKDEIEVEVTTIDEEAARHKIPYIDFLKIDTEGYDFNVLKGAKRLLSQQKIGIIQFEYNNTWVFAGNTLISAISFLNSFDYRVFLLRPEGLFELDYHRYGEYFKCSNYIAVSPGQNWLVDLLYKGRR